jgi:hypothetical protein
MERGCFAEKIDNLDWHICGKGFVFNKEQVDEDKKVAEQGFELWLPDIIAKATATILSFSMN